MESKFSTADAVAALSVDRLSNDTQETDNRQLFSAFIEHYQHGVFGFLGRMGFSQTEAEDLAQEVFLKVWRYRASYNPQKAQPSTWLYAIVRNTALNKLRSTRGDHTELSELEIAADKQFQPEQQLQRQQTQKKVSAAINKLSPDDRCAIALFYLDDLTGDQAANILQCSTAAFKTRLSRARNKLKNILNTMDETND